MNALLRSKISSGIQSYGMCCACWAQRKLSSTLTSRKIIRLGGNEVAGFLQGLISNDTLKLQQQNILFSFLLNIQGRIIADLFVHKEQGNSEEYFVDCDKAIHDELIRTFKKYKLRKKIEISDCTEMKVVQGPSANSHSMCNQDPRMPELGFRSLVPLSAPSNEDSSEFTLLRYSLGVGEGVVDHPPHSSLPLESNAAFLNAVSFSKGCYLGQELTARSHYTGVVRKRLLPICFDDNLETSNELLTVKVSKDTQVIGKIRSFLHRSGLGLLRLQIAHQKMDVCDERGNVLTTAVTSFPAWWQEGDSEMTKFKNNLAS